MNYLAVRALHHYSNTEGPYKQLAAQLYTDLRYWLAYRGLMVEPGHLRTKQCLAASQRITGRAMTPVH